MIKPGDEPIPGYRLEALLGKGQFGQVWRARSPGNTTLALKFLELSGTHGWKEFRAIQRVKQIRHAHLMPIVAIWLLDEHGQILSDDVVESIAANPHESGDSNSAADTLVVEPVKQTRRPAQLIVATLLANKTLGDRLRECQEEGRRGIPMEELRAYMEEAAKGLDYLNLSEHKIGEGLGAVQHCDVKPDNIMLAGGSVVISDFGVAQTLAQARQTTTATSLGGTPAYMAPECFANKPCKATDQYSLAVTYYELRTGRLPFEEQTYAAVYRAHHEGNLDFTGCKPNEQQVLRKATAVDPKERFATCAEFVDALNEAVTPQAPREARSSRLAPIAAVAAGAILAAASFVVWRYWSRGEAAIVDPPKVLAKVSVTVEPANAEVTVDAKPAALDGNGRLVLEREPGQSLTIKASHFPDRQDGELRIDSIRGDEQHTITLPFSASHFANQADQFLKAGKIDDGVAALAEAIKLKPDEYAKLPEPSICLSGDDPVECLQLAIDGRWLLSGSRDGTVRRWPIDASGVRKMGEIIHQHEGQVEELIATDEFTASIAGGGDAVLLTGGSGQTLELAIPPKSGEIAHIAICGGGRWLIAATESIVLPPEPKKTGVYAWDLEHADIGGSRKQLVVILDEVEPRLAAAHDEAWAALTTTDGESYALRLVAADAEQDGKPIYKQDGEMATIAVSPDDRWIAVGGKVAPEDESFRYGATLINQKSRRFQSLPRGHADSIVSIAFDKAGDFMATGGEDGRALAWTIPDDWDASEPLTAEPIFLDENKEPISSVVCPQAGWTVCNHQGQVTVWSCKPGATDWVNLPMTAVTTSMACTPDGEWLVTGHEDGKLRLWPMTRLKAVMKACALTGKRPQTLEAPVDKVTRSDRSSPRDPRFPSGSAGIAHRRGSRPTVAPGG